MAKDDCKILDAEISSVANCKIDNFAYKVAHDGSKVTTAFKYLNRGAGATLRLYHTGTSDEQLEIHGNLIGGHLVDSKQMQAKRVRVSNIGYFLLLMIIFVSCISSLVWLVNILDVSAISINSKDGASLPKNVKQAMVHVLVLMPYISLVVFLSVCRWLSGRVLGNER